MGTKEEMKLYECGSRATIQMELHELPPRARVLRSARRATSDDVTKEALESGPFG